MKFVGAHNYGSRDRSPKREKNDRTASRYQEEFCFILDNFMSLSTILQS